MSDKENVSFQQGDEEEFHITDEDIDRELAAMDAEQPVTMSDESIEAVASEEKSSKKNRFALLKQLKRKHWIIIVVVLVIVFLGLMKMIGGESTSSLEPIEPITTMPETKSTAKLPKLESKTTSAAAVSTAPSSSSTNSLPDLSKVSAQPATTSKNTADEALIEIQKQNQMLVQQMTTLSQRVVGLESSLTQSNQAVEGLSQQLMMMKQPMSGSMPATTPVMTAPVTTSTPMSLPPTPQYTVEAVVPQRAWLQAADGNTLTVTVGDDIPGMGAVTAIDPYSGNVSTASGTTIKYAN